MAAMRVLGLIGLLCTLLFAASAGTADDREYRLSSGDRLRVTVFGEPSLSGEFEVDGVGTFSLPLIGTVDAQNETARGLEQRIADMLSAGYLRQPRVSVEVLTYRPFYIFGEVNSPGSYPYRAGMTLLNAVAVAGGYTYRANERRVEVKRGEADPFNANPQEIIMPGDIIRVNERLF